MPLSRRYGQLRSRILKLEGYLLPDTKPLGNYTLNEQDRIRSFILLVHAEIEAYFEDRALKILTKEFNKWKNSRKRSNSLMCLMGFLMDKINWDKEKKQDKDQIEFRLHKVFNYYKHEVIGKNHGIKSENLIKLLCPIGFEVTDFDSTWLIEMDNFASFRGQIAHNTLSVQQAIDKLTELNRVKNNIMPGIEKIDQDLSKI